MINTAKTLKTFFGGFSIPAYAQESVPENTQLPYITYPLVEPEWDEQATFYCQVWYRKNRLADLLAKADQVVKAIGTGVILEQNGGYVVIYPSTPLIQMITDDDSQRVYINLSINAYHMPGD